MLYDKFKYIFPPRPKNAAPASAIGTYDNGAMVGQAKSNGSNCSLYTNGIVMAVYNRHNERLTGFSITQEEINDTLFKCERGNWMMWNGEYMNKSKNDENGNVFNHKLVLFDTLVVNSDYLLGKTYQERLDILDDLYGTNVCERKYYHKVSDNIFKVINYYKDYAKLYDEMIKTDMIEGLVLKRKNARLEPGRSEINNEKSMIKFRKPTKNYKF